jgi:hypothetical protein
MAELPASGEMRRVLIIDSDAAFVRALEADFELRAFLVDTAADGAGLRAFAGLPVCKTGPTVSVGEVERHRRFVQAHI